MVWPIFWFVFKLVLSYAISYALAPKPGAPDDATAAGINSFNTPTAIVGRAVPVLFGTKPMSGPNCVWSGDLKTTAIVDVIDGGLFDSDTDVTVGYKYYLGMHLVLAHEIDAITKIEVDKKTAWEGSSTGGEIYVNAPSLMGGERSGGGVQGYIDFETGASGQLQNAYLQSVLGADIPAFRGVAAVVLKQVYLSTSSNILPWSFWCRKIPTWYPAKAQIGQDANPACILVETFTNKIWGLGADISDVNEASFIAAADKLYTEGFGLSLVWDYSTRLEDFILEILKHIDGSIYIDRTTGQFTIKLIRQDYDIETIPVFDETNITKVSRFKRRSTNDLINTVAVDYWDASTGENGSTSISDPALVYTMGGTVKQAMSYKGVTSHSLAATLALRDLRALSAPLADSELYTTRDGAQLNVGDAFLASHPRYGVEAIVMRVTGVEFGEYGDSNIRIECVEDFYGADEAIYSVPPGSLWVDPNNEPAACPVHSAIEAPFFLVMKQTTLPPADIALLTGGFACIAGSAPTQDSTDADAYFNIGAGYFKFKTINFAPSGVLLADIGKTDTTLSISYDGNRGSIVDGSWAIIDGEIVEVISTTSSTLVCGRGCLDTVPNDHVAGVSIIFSSWNYALCNTLSSTSVTAKLLTRTGLGVLDIASAPEQTITINDRIARPYPPGKLRLNGDVEPLDILGNVTQTWEHRDRILQTTIYDTEAAGIGPEAGTTYTASFYRNDTSALLHEATGITANSLVTTNFDIGYEGLIDYTLKSVRDGFDSWQEHARQFYYVRAEIRIAEDGTARVTEDGTPRIVEI